MNYKNKCLNNYNKWNNDIKLIREKNKIKKNEILKRLNIIDNNYTLYELEQLELKERIKQENFINKEKREKERQLKLKELGINIDSDITDSELEKIYIKRLELRERLKKQTNKFYKETETLNTDFEYITNEEKYYLVKNDDNDNYNDNDNDNEYSLFHNPGGAIIYTKQNSQNQMVYNCEKGIYEPEL